jgi:metal-responsive CopG/Arc/MetJ family transcriptional regulator
MSARTSIAISEELLKEIAVYEKKYKNRSAFVEAAIWAFVKQLAYEQKSIADIEIINENAERLNAEAMDVLSYQVSL